MASIELRGNAFRIVFRYQRQKFNRSLKTDDPDTANACLARVEDNLRRLDMGLIAVPEGADICQFLLSDGRSPTRAARHPEQLRTLGALLDKFWLSIESQRREIAPQRTRPSGSRPSERLPASRLE